jgi:hypothetical protein
MKKFVVVVGCGMHILDMRCLGNIGVIVCVVYVFLLFTAN